MRIVNLTLPPDVTSERYGLAGLDFRDLGSVVVLAGPNGGGKTRTLAAVKEVLQLMENLDHNRTILSKYERRVATGETFPPSEHARMRLLKGIRDGVELDERQQLAMPPSVSFVPQSTDILDARDSNARDLGALAEQARSSLGFDQAKKSTLAYIQQVWSRRWNATHKESAQSEADRVHAVSEFDRLNELINTVLGGSLGGDRDGHVTLFGKPVSDAKLSSGQRVLLQFSVALHAQHARLGRCFLFLDEPENHLHPGVLIETLERIHSLASGSQMWIATHSIHVVSQFGASGLYLVDGGRAHYASRAPEKVLRGLLGSEEQIARTRQLLAEPEQNAIATFAAQCLSNPEVSDSSSDPQTTQIASLVAASEGSKTLLDFGAGRGRVLAALDREFAVSGKTIRSHLNYFAFDANTSNEETCKRTISQVYGNDRQRWYSDLNALETSLGSSKFDYVLACNVLHEIEPADWLELFAGGSGVGRFLRPDGSLLIVEDHEMPVGEMAHSKGFLVLPTLALMDLFCAEAGEISVSDARGDGRLLMHRVPAALLKRISCGSRVAALERVQRLAVERIRSVRLAAHAEKYKQGLKHAFWTQQLANATLALRELR